MKKWIVNECGNKELNKMKEFFGTIINTENRLINK